MPEYQSNQPKNHMQHFHLPDDALYANLTKIGPLIYFLKTWADGPLV